MLKVYEAQDGLSVVQRTLVERCLGVVVSFMWGGRRLSGTITFVDYDVFCVRVETDRGTKFVDPRRCTVVSRRTERVPVMHHVRLNSYRHGSGWYGSAVADPEVADAWLEPASAARAA